MENTNSASSLKYLDPITVSRLKNMEMRARLVVEGFITGLHKSPYHGFSVEFAEHRLYPGCVGPGPWSIPLRRKGGE